MAHAARRHALAWGAMEYAACILRPYTFRKGRLPTVVSGEHTCAHTGQCRSAYSAKTGLAISMKYSLRCGATAVSELARARRLGLARCMLHRIVRRCAALQPIAYGAMRRPRPDQLSRQVERLALAQMRPQLGCRAAVGRRLRCRAGFGREQRLGRARARLSCKAHCSAVLGCSLLLRRMQPVANHTSERPQRALICLAI